MGYDMYLVNETGDRDADYFRLNIWGMKVAREIMYPLGMAHDHGREGQPAYVTCPDEHYDRAERCDCNDPWLSYSPEVPGIPAWKVGSNDGWIVTPIDCQGALHMLAANGPAEDAPEWWDGWCSFIQRAAENGGFRVH